MGKPIRGHDKPGVEGCGPAVLVWDSHQARLQVVCREISQCGACARLASDLGGIEAGAMAALVTLDDGEACVDEHLGLIRSLAARGIKVICYGDGCGSWRLGRRCALLVAGAVDLLESGAREFGGELRRTLSQLVRAAAAVEADRQAIREALRAVDMVGESEALQAVFRTALRVGRLSDLPVLITGETGTGKERFARAIHGLDPKRGAGPFVPVNCGAISLGLAESELFGHRRGAFTGADRDRQGLIRAAQGGVLFLDEIGELDAALQAKLLRVLQENRVLSVGEEREVAVNVRVIAATNRDLKALVAERKFRADLFHRLGVLPIHIPPLRERPEDVRPLVEYFLVKHRALHSGGGALQAGADFLDAVGQLELPGNARQLENIVRQALVRAEGGGTLRLSHLPSEWLRRLSEETLAAPATPEPELGEGAGAGWPEAVLERNGSNLSRSIEECEGLLLKAALRRTRGNQARTAALLGITPRSVYNKLRKLRIKAGERPPRAGSAGR